MCVDFTDLNKAYQKDSYPLPNIDQLVDKASRYRYLKFMDAYSRYNQIRMCLDDEEKTSFITEDANFCYRVTSFGLRNARAVSVGVVDPIRLGMLYIDNCNHIYY